MIQNQLIVKKKNMGNSISLNDYMNNDTVNVNNNKVNINVNNNKMNTNVNNRMNILMSIIIRWILMSIKKDQYQCQK